MKVTKFKYNIKEGEIEYYKDKYMKTFLVDEYMAEVDPYIEGDKSKGGIYYVNKEGRPSEWTVVYDKPVHIDCRSFKTRLKYAWAYYIGRIMKFMSSGSTA